MTLLELLETLDRIGRRQDVEDLRVVVQTAQGAMCHNRMVEVERVSGGFDWTKSLLMVFPAEPVIVHRAFDRPLEEVARERLAGLQAASAVMGGKYIHKSREGEWADGFKEGVKAFTLAHGATLPDGDTVPVQRSLLEAIVQTGATEGLEGIRPLLAQLGKCQTNAVQEKP